MNTQGRIDHIDAWRFIAANIVIFGHLVIDSNFSTAPWPSLHPAWTLLFALLVWFFAHFSWHWFDQPLIRIDAGWTDSIVAMRQTALVAVAK
jgi:peptidoglycan/LPS O-acetylase OafA/YrhL